jgi:hypothetical protein
MKKKIPRNGSPEVKGLLRYFHLTKRFRQRVGEEPMGAEIFDMLEQTKNNPECFLKWTRKYNVGMYKVNFRGRDIIIISNKKAIFTTYGVYTDAFKEISDEEAGL